jgi:hypothetical protein
MRGMLRTALVAAAAGVKVRVRQPATIDLDPVGNRKRLGR